MKPAVEIFPQTPHIDAMANTIVPPPWRIPESAVTPESVHRNRRRFLRDLGFGAAGTLALASAGNGYSQSAVPSTAAGTNAAGTGRYPARRNPDFDPKWKLSDEKTAATYNNYYEFSTQKDRVHRLVDGFVITPWPVEIYGLCEKPWKGDLNELIAEFGLEERIYRFRCVEAWAMIVPWTGFPLAKLLEKVVPKSDAKFVRFETVARPTQMPAYTRLVSNGYPLPYNEGLRIDEAMHPLTLVATGIYGKALPKQHGAPARLVVPWKYGYKSIKSIVKIELISRQPATLWETLAPDEYPFESNVNPTVPHPRWSQATERMIDTGDRVPTQPYNGYAEAVAKLYKKS